MLEMRKVFHSGLKEIENDVIAMGSMVENSLKLSVEALRNRDLVLAERIIADDDKVNSKRFDIEERSLFLVATQQPVGSELRIIASILNIIWELERIADHAEGIARVTIMIGDEPPLKPLVDIPRMMEKVNNMLRRSLEAFINRDADTARKISTEDDEIDNLYDQIFRELLSFMAEDPRTITRATRLIWGAHNLERSGDRITNICERVVFIVTGKMEEIGASKY
jgi:phosphate transport system protein